MAKWQCAIWNTDIRQGFTNGSTTTLSSIRTGGEYTYLGSVANALENLSPREKAKLTTWLVDQRRSGESRPVITHDILALVGRLPTLTFSSRVDRLFELLITHLDTIGEKILIKDRDVVTDFGQELCAWTECNSYDELYALLMLLWEQGHIRETERGSGTWIEPTSKGYERLDQAGRRSAFSKSAFVAMWYDPTMDGAYIHGIEPAIREAGYNPIHLGRSKHNNKIDDEIITSIRRSRFVVAEFSCEIIFRQGEDVGVSRGNVYFETGLALGLNIPIFWCCKKECLTHIHFDTRQYPYIVWEKYEELRTLLLARIEANII